METGAITEYIDVAQLVLYLFWIFFAGVLFYLRREDKREGYPLQSDAGRRISVQGFPAMPPPKTFQLEHGATVTVPNADKDMLPIQAAPLAPWPGAPLEPTGDPMRDGVGPAARPPRATRPDLAIDGLPMIAPMRVATDFVLAPGEQDPRGMDVYGADRNLAGIVQELWVDRSEPQVRYLEVALSDNRGVVLLPMPFASIDEYRRRVETRALLAAQFAGTPRTARPDEITLDEEDRISAYFGGGMLYAMPTRLGPWL